MQETFCRVSSSFFWGVLPQVFTDEKSWTHATGSSTAARALAALILNSRPAMRAIEILDNRACQLHGRAAGMLRAAFEFKSITG